jgi:hypothetical protein
VELHGGSDDGGSGGDGGNDFQGAGEGTNSVLLFLLQSKN